MASSAALCLLFHALKSMMPRRVEKLLKEQRSPVLVPIESLTGKNKIFKSLVPGEPAELLRKRRDSVHPFALGLQALDFGRN